MIKLSETIHPAGCECRQCTAPQRPQSIERKPAYGLHPVVYSCLVGLAIWSIVIGGIAWLLLGAGQ